MRSFEFTRKKENGNIVFEGDKEILSYPDAQLPEYQTKAAAGADFFCAEDIVIPSIWKNIWKIFDHEKRLKHFPLDTNIVHEMEEVKEVNKWFSPTLVHTGIKACMEDDEVLIIANRSSGPKKLGLILANSIGVIDADYYNNPDNDGEIMFAYYNIKPWDVKIKKGDRIGQGFFQKYLRPEIGLKIKDVKREGGFGSTK